MMGYETMGWRKIGMYASMAGKDEASHNRSDTIGERCSCREKETYE
jgi:tagatose-1,6-bisphosphate aldolase non-catalytic subunit AgaZ/GatZ